MAWFIRSDSWNIRKLLRSDSWKAKIMISFENLKLPPILGKSDWKVLRGVRICTCTLREYGSEMNHPD